MCSSRRNFIPITYWIEFHSFYYPSDILLSVYVSVNIEFSEVAETLNNLIRNAFLLLEKVESIKVKFQLSDAQGWIINMYLIFSVKLSTNLNMRIIFIQDFTLLSIYNYLSSDIGKWGLNYFVFKFKTFLSISHFNEMA